MKYADLADMTEDERIHMIGVTCIGNNALIGFVVEDENGKAERYIKKLEEQFPGITIVDNTSGPLKGVRTVRVAPPKSSMS